MFILVWFPTGKEESSEHVTIWPCLLPVYKPSMVLYSQPEKAHNSCHGTQGLPCLGPAIVSSSVPLFILPNPETILIPEHTPLCSLPASAHPMPSTWECLKKTWSDFNLTFSICFWVMSFNCLVTLLTSGYGCHLMISGFEVSRSEFELYFVTLVQSW